MHSLVRHLLALFTLLLGALLVGLPVWAQAPAPTDKTEVLWLGQSCFRITTPGGKVIVIDPWLVNNPKTPAAYKRLEALGKVDVILVTHGHADHFADAPALARLHNVPVRAEHSSVVNWRNPATDKDEVHFGGEPLGYIIELENGFRVYHAGDTAVFGDMKYIGERYRPDLALVPIGGNFTMDPADAAYAVRELIRPKVVIPMHFGTNPLAKGTAKEFVDAMGAGPVKVIIAEPGQALLF